MPRRGMVTLGVTILLCLPSLLGCGAVLMNGVLGRRMAEWGTFSSVTVGAGVFLGGPLVLAASVVSAVAGFRSDVSEHIKYAHYGIVSAAMLATFGLTFHFGM